MYPVLDHHFVSQQRALHQTMCKMHRRPDKNLCLMLQLDRIWKFIQKLLGHRIFPVQSHQNK